eukprot:62473_1
MFPNSKTPVQTTKLRGANNKSSTTSTAPDPIKDAYKLKSQIDAVQKSQQSFKTSEIIQIQTKLLTKAWKWINKYGIGSLNQYTKMKKQIQNYDILITTIASMQNDIQQNFKSLHRINKQHSISLNNIQSNICINNNHLRQFKSNINKQFIKTHNDKQQIVSLLTKSNQSLHMNENETETENNNDKYFENEYFIETICSIPNDYIITMLHLAKFNQQSKKAITNPKVLSAQKLLEESQSKIKIENGISNNKLEYENLMILNSETPLFIMCDTCSILRMVALTKKSAMNYWETMLTHTQKMEYILYYTKLDCLRKEKYLNNCEMYARKLRIEILPILQLHLNTDEIKEIANKLMKIAFKKLMHDKNGNNNILYCDKYKNIIICQMYRFVALYP